MSTPEFPRAPRDRYEREAFSHLRTVARGQCCQAQGSIFGCTLYPGHEPEDHVAGGAPDEVLARWPASPAPSLPLSIESIHVHDHALSPEEVRERYERGLAQSTPTCVRCNDTHTMVREGRGDVMCTFCPLPCERCRSRGPGIAGGPYCEATPCPCSCHARKESTPTPQAGTRESVEPDGPCAFCGEPTSSFAGNPGRWPLWFGHPDGSGVVKAHHVACVTERLFPAAPSAAPAVEPVEVRKPERWVMLSLDDSSGERCMGIVTASSDMDRWEAAKGWSEKAGARFEDVIEALLADGFEVRLVSGVLPAPTGEASNV